MLLIKEFLMSKSSPKGMYISSVRKDLVNYGSLKMKKLYPFPAPFSH